VKNVSAYVTCEMENNILNGFKKFISTVQWHELRLFLSLSLIILSRNLMN
jgi:hypothetical protein